MAGLATPKNVWIITGPDRERHDQQFFAQKPVNGFLTGEQARNFFLKSGLPSNVLAQVWNLADLNKDGKMDRKEFSIAMHLIQKKLQGFSLPDALPESMKADPQPSLGSFGPMPSAQPMGVPVPMGPNMTMPAGGMSPQMRGFSPQHMGAMGTLPPMGGTLPPIGPVPPMRMPMVPADPQQQPRRDSKTVDWSMPQATKLKYSQMFNNLDKGRVGYLTGVHARNIMSHSGLPNPILAQIWNLSDLDKDGKLTSDEFSIAMHLIDMAKTGEYTLPFTTPLELVQQSTRARTLSATSGASEGSGTGNGMLPDGMAPVGDFQEEPPQKRHPVSFEDRRKENFNKGQAELDRRRQILQEQEKREKEERARKEREEAERREAERKEQERRRQLEIEKQLAKQREIELQQQEEYRKMMEQREAARRELEKQRQQEMERLKLQELTQERQREQEATCHLKQKHKNLSFQYQALSETAADLNTQITEIRQQMVAYTSSIEGMRKQRDEKMSAISALKSQIETAGRNANALLRERQGLESQKGSLMGGPSGNDTQVSESYRQVMHSYHNKEINMEKLRACIAELERENREKGDTTEEKSRYFETLRNQLNYLKQEQQHMQQGLVGKQATARALLGRKSGKIPTAPANDFSPPTEDAWGPPIDQPVDAPIFDDAFSAGGGANGPLSSGQDAGGNGAPEPVSVRYRALYEFSAQNEDELSFQPGDIIEVFTNHAAEPGWLAGQFREKVGWFPAAYAEPIDGASGGGATSNNATSPVGGQSPGHMARIVGGEVQLMPKVHEEPSFEKDEHHAGAVAAPGVTSAPVITRSGTQESVKSRHSANGSGGMPTPRQHSLGTDLTAGAGGQPMLCQAQALYPWKAKKDDQLTFAKGDLLSILEQGEMWWKGRLDDGREGWFPKSYAKIVANAQVPVPEKNGAPVAPGEPKFCIALYNFVAVESDDLGFSAGDRIEILFNEGEWWTGRLEGREGIFPANHVKLPAPGDLDPAGGKSQVARAPSQESSSGGKAVVEKQLSRESGTGSLKSAAGDSAGGSGGSFEVGQVIAPFSGSATNQLTIQPGDLVKIRAKSPTGWWEGELQRKGEQKRVGWFPGNFVKTLSQDSGGGGAGGQQQNAVVPKSGSRDSMPKSDSQQNVIQKSVSGDNFVAGIDNTYVALYDYAAQQADELSFKAGTKILVLEKVDQSWWKGQTLDEAATEGMFPVNYVVNIAEQSETAAPGAQPTAGTPGSPDDIDLRFTAENGNTSGGQPISGDRKRSVYIEELVQTERNYLDDLDMIKKVFFQPILESKILSEEQQKRLLVNSEELRKVGKEFYKALKSAWRADEARVGEVIRDFLPKFKAFVTFCQYQQGALDLVDSLERTNPAFRQVYNHCLQHPAARHLGLSYFLLIPMTRVTKYPLLLEKVVKYTDPDRDPDQYSIYQQVLEGMKNLCKEVNHVVSEMENLEMLYWCQNHVKTDPLRPKLVFNSLTHALGPRKFLHSGVLYKAKSGRLLVGLLFTDILLLTTPDDDQIGDPVSFKLTRISDLELGLYRSPILLEQASVTTSSGSENSNESICITTPVYTTQLKPATPNARVLWMRELDKAMKHAKTGSVASPTGTPAPQKGIGRLLLEVVCVRGLVAPMDYIDCKTLCELTFGGGQFQRTVVDLKGKGAASGESAQGGSPLITTQFVIESRDANLQVAFYAAQIYAPNLCLGSMEVNIGQLLAECGVKKTPSVKQYPLASSLSSENNCHVILKCVIQMFE